MGKTCYGLKVFKNIIKTVYTYFLGPNQKLEFNKISDSINLENITNFLEDHQVLLSL